MIKQLITLFEWFQALLRQLLELTKNQYRRWHRNIYQPEQEHVLDLKRLTNQQIKGLNGYIHHTAAMNMLSGMLLVAFLVMSFIMITEVTENPQNAQVYITFMAMPVFLLFCQFVVGPDSARKSLRRTVSYFWDHPDVANARSKYRYFYIPEDETIVFTNAKPSFLICPYPYQKTCVDWRQYKNNRIVEIIDWFIVSTVYLRFVWPFILSPLQLAFLAYRTAMKKVDFKPGMKVLMIGAGPLPYHVWWKKKLGPGGHIVALDIDQYVNNTSRQVETVYERLRALVTKPRWVSTHVVGDAEELPFQRNTFDLVIAIRCYHLNIEEGLRVLKSGGQVVACPFTQVVNLYPETQKVEESLSWQIVAA